MKMNFNTCEFLSSMDDQNFPIIINNNRNRHSRVRAVLFVVGHSQIVALHHEDVKLSQLLDEVHCKLDAPLDFNVIDAANAATNLLVEEHRKLSFHLDPLIQC